MLVEKMVSSSKGTAKLLPVCSLRKSTLFCSGTIQRLSSSSGVVSWRPKSSMMKVPPKRLHVKRRLVEARVGIVLQVQHFKRQLTTGDHDGAFTGDPALVENVAADRNAGLVAGAPLSLPCECLGRKP